MKRIDDSPGRGPGIAAGLCLSLAALAAWGGVVVRSDNADEAASMFRDVAANRGPELGSAALFVFAAIFFGAAGVGLARVAAGLRASRMTTAAAWLIVTGGAWWIVRAWSNVLVFGATGAKLPPGQALAAYEQFSGTAGFSIFLPLLLAFILAPLILGLGLWRSELIPGAVVVIYVFGIVGFLVTETNRSAEAVAFGLMALSLIWMGLRVAFPAAGGAMDPLQPLAKEGMMDG